MLNHSPNNLDLFTHDLMLMNSLKNSFYHLGLLALISMPFFSLVSTAQAHSNPNLIARYSSTHEYNPPTKFYVLGGLFTYSRGSHINVRSGPGTEYIAKHYGLPGDRVFVLNEAQGNDGYRWWYLKFKDSGARGWIREDFVAIPDSGLREIAAKSRR